jgi:hypothetical protein
MERWYLLINGVKGIEVTRADVEALDLVPCGGVDVQGLPLETYFVYRGDPAGDQDWHLSCDPPDEELPL